MAETREQVIRLIYDASQAEAQARTFANAEQKRARDNAAAQAKAAKEAAAAQMKAAKEAAAAQVKAAKEAAAAAKTSEKTRADLNAETNSLLKRHAQEEAAAAKALARERARASREAMRQEIQDIRNKHALAMQTWDAERKKAIATAAAQKEVSVATQGVVGNLASMSASMIGLGSGMQVLGTVKEIWRGIAEEAERAAAAASGFHMAERESGTLVGKTATQVSPEILKLMGGSGLQRQEADSLFRQFYGSLPAGLQKGNITENVAKDLLAQTAVTAARQGGDAGVKGDLAGILPMFGKIDSAEAGMGQLEAIRQALTEGRGDDTPLTRSLLNVAGTMVREGGAVGTLPELAALVGTTSLSAGPGMADTRALQATRAVRGTDKKQMEAIEKQFGIKQGSKMGLEERLDMIVPKLREVSKTQDVGSWLTTEIGTPQEDAQALIELMGNYDVLKQRFASARKGTAGGATVANQNKEFLASALGQQMKGKAKQEIGQYLVGSRNQDALALVEGAKGIQAAEPPGFNKMMEETFHRATSLGGWGRAEAKANELLVSQGRRAGIEHLFPSESLGTPALDQIQHKADVLRANGQDPYMPTQALTAAFVGNPLDKLISLQEQQLEETKKQNGLLNGKGRVAAPARPVPLVTVPGRPGDTGRMP